MFRNSLRSFVLFNTFIFMISLSHVIFLIPNKIASGGFMSLSLILFHVFNLSIDEGIGVALIDMSMNFPLLIYSLRLFGKEYVLKTVYSIIMLPIFTISISSLFLLTSFEIPDMSIWLAAFLGAIITGVGIGGANVLAGSSGGTDILAKMMNHFNDKISMGMGISIVKIIIVLLSATVFSISHAIAAIFAATLVGFIVDFTTKIMKSRFEC